MLLWHYILSVLSLIFWIYYVSHASTVIYRLPLEDFVNYQTNVFKQETTTTKKTKHETCAQYLNELTVVCGNNSNTFLGHNNYNVFKGCCQKVVHENSRRSTRWVCTTRHLHRLSPASWCCSCCLDHVCNLSGRQWICFNIKFQQKHPMKWPWGCNTNVQLTTCTSSATSTTATKWWMTTVPFRTFSTSSGGVVSRWPQSGPANLSPHCSNNRFSTMPHSVTSINNQFILLLQSLSLELH